MKASKGEEGVTALHALAAPQAFSLAFLERSRLWLPFLLPILCQLESSSFLESPPHPGGSPRPAVSLPPRRLCPLISEYHVHSGTISGSLAVGTWRKKSHRRSSRGPGP